MDNNPDGSLNRIQEKLGRTLEEIMRSLSSQIKVLNGNMSRNIPSQAQRREIRFQTINIDLPQKEELIGIRKEERIKQWLGKVCKEVWTVSFDAFQNNLISQGHLKPFCSENLIGNILNLSHHCDLTNGDFMMMNECLKKQLIPYFQAKYPLVEECESSVRFASMLIPIDHREEVEYDIFLKSGVKFTWEESGNYNEQIMRFLNYIIETPNSEMKKLFPELKEDGEETLANRFQKDMKEQLGRIESKNWTESWNQFLKKRQNNKEAQFQFKQVNPNDKESRQHRQKVRSYSTIKTGRKIGESILPFSDIQCRSGNLNIEKSSIMRILTKWCGSLLDYFDKKYRVQSIEYQSIPFYKVGLLF